MTKQEEIESTVGQLESIAEFFEEGSARWQRTAEEYPGDQRYADLADSFKRAAESVRALLTLQDSDAMTTFIKGLDAALAAARAKATSG